MEWRFNTETPLYLQIMEQIKAQIASGTLKAGQKLMSVRELAFEAGVNPNTVQKALSELEREGLLYSERTSGRFVSDIHGGVDDVLKQLSEQYMDIFLDNMNKLGLTKDETLNLFTQYVKEHKD